MKAVGSIMINGEYKVGETKKDFRESIDLDILALFDKITDKRDFHVKVEDFDYTINDGNLALAIQACIYGVKDDEDRIIETENTREEVNDEDIASEIEDLLREEVVAEPVVELPVVESEPVVQITEPQEVVVDKHIEQIQDTMDDEDDLGTYYLYVVQDGDTYQSIAARYQTDELKLKDYNHERSLAKGTIVIVPYSS